MKKTVLSLAMVIAMLMSIAIPTFAVEVTDFPENGNVTSVASAVGEEMPITPRETVLYSGEGYAGTDEYPASGEFTVPASGEVRVVYGLIHPEGFGESTCYLMVTKRNSSGDLGLITEAVVLTADQTARVATLGTLSPGNYHFELVTTTSDLLYAIINIVAV